MKKFIYILSFIFILSSVVKADDIKWYSFKDGFEKAAKEGKYILVDFYTDWCGWCKKMDKETFSNEKVINLINKNFIAVKFNPEKDNAVNFQGETFKAQDFAKAAGVSGYPAFGFFTADQQFIEVIPGYKPAGEFSEVLEFMIDGKYMKMSYANYSTYTQVYEHFSTLERKNPEDSDIEFVLAFVHLELKENAEKAKNYLNEIIARNKNYNEAYAGLAIIYEFQGNTKKYEEYKSIAEKKGITNLDEAIGQKMMAIMQKFTPKQN